MTDLTRGRRASPAGDQRPATRLVISFSGLDGAGKTRQISALQADLAGLGLASEVAWIPFKIWPEPLLNKLPASFRSRLGPSRSSPGGGTAASGTGPAPARAPLARARSAVLGRVWTVVAVFAAVSAGLSLRRRVRGLDAPVVILDRYRLDSAVKLRFWYSDVRPGLLLGLVRRLAPQPDLELLLRVRPEVAWDRKPEQWSVRQLARQAAAYDEAAEGSAVVVLDGEAPPAEVEAEIARLLREVLGAG